MCALPPCVASKGSSHDLPKYPQKKRLRNRHASPPNGRPMYATGLCRLQWSAYVRNILPVTNPICEKISELDPSNSDATAGGAYRTKDFEGVRL